MTLCWQDDPKVCRAWCLLIAQIIVTLSTTGQAKIYRDLEDSGKHDSVNNFVRMYLS